MVLQMEVISVTEFARLHNISERTVRNYCSGGKISGAYRTGGTWSIPADAAPPRKRVRTTKSPLLKALREQKEMKMKGGIYHKTQIDLTYNSNHMEGSKLTHEQTRLIFETRTIGVDAGTVVRIDDIIETANHFRCIDYIIDHAEEKLSERFVKHLHQQLKQNTADAEKEWFRVGEYKALPNEVGAQETSLPENVASDMKELLGEYNQKSSKTIEDIIDFHQRFESIHPFQDGNGRVGRLIMFKECLANNIVPFIIDENLRLFYYRGLREWPHVRGYLLDTCLTAQDNYKAVMDYFKIAYK